VNRSEITTPEGTRDRIYSQCTQRRAVERAVTELFLRRGYCEIMTPEVEYYDLFIRSGNPLPQESMLKIIDRSGRIIVMRPDNTTPIARVAATKLRNAPRPMRLFYNQTVFRSDESHRGRRSEIAQCGVELLGAGGIRPDIEVIALAVQTLEEAGARDYQIELGHAGFFRSLVAQLDTDEETVESMRLYIENKNFAALADRLEPFANNPAYPALRKLSALFGGAEVLDEAERLSAGLASDCLDYLRRVFTELSRAGYGDRVRFDLGMVHRLDYYSGVVFRGYVRGSGRVVLSGGRYDTLFDSFGLHMPATGFALDVDAITESLPTPSPLKAPDAVLRPEAGMLRRALLIIDSSPPGEYVLTSEETMDGTMEEARRLGARRVVMLGESEEEILL
jgi:ATP phosphoribosyltransferase regulatory subunit